MYGSDLLDEFDANWVSRVAVVSCFVCFRDSGCYYSVSSDVLAPLLRGGLGEGEIADVQATVGDSVVGRLEERVYFRPAG